ncbi:MAG: hypothetical protein Q8Q01_04455 [archaeon]|nr:hypothetical protein [archaeon]
MEKKSKTNKISSWSNQKEVHYDNELDVINRKLANLHTSTAFPSIRPTIRIPAERINPFREVKTEEKIKPKLINLNQFTNRTEFPAPKEIPIDKNKAEIKLENKMLIHQLGNAANDLQNILINQFGITPEPEKKSFLQKILLRNNY